MGWGSGEHALEMKCGDCLSLGGTHIYKYLSDINKQEILHTLH